MKKFLKWSAAFLVLGVLAVGCIKNEPSQGIEAMRNAKAALLTAQAALEQAKVQVEAANAALIQAQASLLKAQEAIVAAQAKKILAEADLIQAEVEWQNALTDFHKEGWAIRIQEMEIELEVIRAEADAAIAAWELQIAQMQAQMVAAQQAYEQALLTFEQWKLANIGTLSQALLNALDGIVLQIQAVILDLGQAQLDLNFAKAQYLWYVNVEYPEAVEHAVLHMERDKMRLECQIEYLAGVVEAYEALYNAYHGEFDELIAGFQEVINALRAGIAEYEIEFIRLQEELLLFNTTALNTALTNLTKNRTVSITGVFSDGGDDPNIHVVDGNYKLVNFPWQATTKTTMFDVMKRDMRVIADTRAEFEDQDSGVIERNIAAKKTAADAAVKKYTDNWNLWQKYYNEARITGSHTGSRYVAWVNAWTAWDAQMASYRVHLNTYDDMYSTADSLIQLYMYYLDGVIDVEDGLITLPGGGNLSDVLGGIYFDAGNLADFVFGSNGQAVIDLINVITVMLDIPGQMDAIVTQLKAIMDGTHDEGWPAFWDHATDWSLKATPAWNDVMREVYANSNKEITDMSKNEWSTWLFLYWLFENRTVEIGLEGAGTVIKINEAGYTDAAAVVLTDFFGLAVGQYETKMNGPSDTELRKAITNYYTALNGLTTKEDDMFEPFGRQWYVTIKDGVTEYPGYIKDDALAAVTNEPLITLKHNPDTYLPPAYNDDPLNQTQPDPEDETQFFFVLEAYQGMAGPIPSLDFDIVYPDPDKCDIWVDYEALIAFEANCEDQTSTWVGDMRLWKYVDRGLYGKGHYFYAYTETKEYTQYEDTKNRVENGEYTALIEKIQALYDAEMALYGEAKALANELQAEYDALTDAIAEYPLYIELFEAYVGEYMYLVHQANWAHNGGNEAEEGLLQALTMHKHKLMEKQHQLAAIEEAMAIFEQGLGLPSYYGFIEDMTAIYQAEIDCVLEDIANLQQQLIILEGIRADLLEDFQ